MLSAAMLSARAAPSWLDREAREGFARRLNGLTERSKLGRARFG
jgi:phage terminase small subunit